MKKLLLIVSVGLLSPINAENCPTCTEGKASFYAEKFHGRKTANGETYNMNALTTAANKEYKFGDKLKVTNKANGKSVIVKVNDRGAFGRKYGRILDLSKAAFKKIANLSKGVISVTVEKIN